MGGTWHSCSEKHPLRILATAFVLSIFGMTAAAHELQPAIADLFLGPGTRAELRLQLNLEAVLAEVGPEHDVEGVSKAAALYERLQKLSGPALAKRAGEALPNPAVLTVKGTPTILGKPEIMAPAPMQVDLPRQSTLVYDFALPDGTTTLTWQFVPTYAPSVIRVSMPDIDAPVVAELVPTGSTRNIVLPEPIHAWPHSGIGILVVAVATFLAVAVLLARRLRRQD